MCLFSLVGWYFCISVQCKWCLLDSILMCLCCVLFVGLYFELSLQCLLCLLDCILSCLYSVGSVCWAVFWVVFTVSALFVGLYYDLSLQCWLCLLDCLMTCLYSFYFLDSVLMDLYSALFPEQYFAVFVLCSVCWTVFCCVHIVLALCQTVFWCVFTLLVLFVGLYFDVCVQCWLMDCILLCA